MTIGARFMKIIIPFDRSLMLLLVVLSLLAGAIGQDEENENLKTPTRPFRRISLLKAIRMSTTCRSKTHV
jgi:hypothetical protein